MKKFKNEVLDVLVWLYSRRSLEYCNREAKLQSKCMYLLDDPLDWVLDN